jgi:hypothetical protein
MRQMQDKLIELEAAQKQQGTAVQKLEESGGTMTLPETLAWLEDIKFYGDFRYRYEYRDRGGTGSDRHRIRARVGLKYKINDEFNFDFRIATSEFFEDDDDDGRTIGGDYVSGNKSLGDYG